ncbi:MAG TPA: ABC transporter substrate-binding protein [Chloroflexota bacterium]|jgi:ABC-type nitrate/sulfonate/bicarbonate transport system substrate-binding protein
MPEIRARRWLPTVWLGCIALLGGLLAGACGPSAAPAGAPAAPKAASAPAGSGPAAAVPAAGGAAAQATSAPAPIALRVAYASPGAALAPVWIAFEQGLFREQGLDVDLVFLSGTRTDQGVVSGDTPIGFGTNVVPTRLAGADVAAIAGVVSRISGELYARPGIATPQDLRGKVVSSTLPGATISVATVMVLRHFGLEPGRDVTIQTTGGSPEKFALVVQGLADATLLAPPDDLKAVEQGLTAIADITPLDIPIVYTAVGAMTPWARDHGEEVRRFLRGYVNAVALARRDPEVARALIAKYTQTDDMAQVDHAYRFYRDVWGRPDFRLPPAAVASVLHVLDTPGADTAKPEDFIDNHFIDELHDSGFIRQSGALD